MHYRVYKLNPAGRITSGEWIQADNEPNARTLARDLCRPGTPSVELWQGARRIAVLTCDDEQAA